MKNKYIPWIEKYRPQKIEDIILDKMTQTKIKKIIADKNMPNIIITGAPGIGKTTTLQCMARELLGPAIMSAVMEINASDDRGIKAQESLVIFCNKNINYSENFAKHRIIILDEADNITIKAQYIINNIMDKYGVKTRFAFTCNSSEKIIESIQSKCVILRYVGLDQKQIIERFKYITKSENIDVNDNILKEIAINSQGDLRNGINLLQLICSTFKNPTIENIYDICDIPQTVVLQEFYENCIEKKFKKAINILEDLKNNGFSCADILTSLFNFLKSSDINEKNKIKLLGPISEALIINSKGIDSTLLLYKCVSDIFMTLSNNN